MASVAANVIGIIIYGATQAFLIVGMWYGHQAEIDGVINLVLFVAWIGIIASAFTFYVACLSQGSQDKILDATKDEAVPWYTRAMLQLLFLAMLIWFGHLVTGICYVVAVALSWILRLAADGRARKMKTRT